MNDDALPPRNFALTRRALLAALAAAVMIPAASLTAYGYFDLQRREREASEAVDRLTRVAHEQAVKVFDLNHEMTERISELLDDSDDAQIRAHESLLHDRIKAIAGNFHQVASVAVFGSHGDLLVSSLVMPAPQLNVMQREAFLRARDARPAAFVSLPSQGPLSGVQIFGTNYGRSDDKGRFLGVISVALKRQYFVDFYTELLGRDMSDYIIGLYRADGGILVRFPDTRPAVLSAANRAVQKAIEANAVAGLLTVTSTVDNVERVLSYRKVDSYPLYLTAGISTAAIFAQWRTGFLKIIGALIGPLIAVWLLILFSLHRLSAEKRAWESWRNETAMRVSAEAATRQFQRMGALGNLVANVAHDFNNLLMVVDANMELARRKQYCNFQKEADAIRRASSSAQRLARRLMSVARKQPLRLERIDLAQWMQAAAPMIATSLGEKCGLELCIPADIGAVKIDAVELESAVINLAVNAKDAMPNGGRFRVAGERLHLAGKHALPPGPYVALCFTDEGAGMSPDVRKRAFEPLFTTKGPGQGTGLGLAQVLAACEQAGGTATIDSAEGAGTTVRLVLPQFLDATVDPPADAETVVDAASNSTGTKQSATVVLLVEDNEEVASGITAVLNVLGCDVQHEINADRALEALSTGRHFDLILSDIQMPGSLSGVELAEHVRAHCPNQKIALMTGYADQLERARQLDVQILAKPFDMTALELLVEESRGASTGV